MNLQSVAVLLPYLLVPRADAVHDRTQEAAAAAAAQQTLQRRVLVRLTVVSKGHSSEITRK